VDNPADGKQPQDTGGGEENDRREKTPLIKLAEAGMKKLETKAVWLRKMATGRSMTGLGALFRVLGRLV
jgi:hypothetical protein